MLGLQSSQMQRSVTISTQRNQILLAVILRSTTEFLVMDLQLIGAATARHFHPSLLKT